MRPRLIFLQLLALAASHPCASLHGADLPLAANREVDFAKDVRPLLQEHWIEVGRPDEKRLLRTTSRVERVSVYSFASSTPVWWKAIESKLTRTENLTVWQIPTEQSRALAALAQRTMLLQVTVQDGAIWIGDGTRSIEVAPVRLCGKD